MLREREAIHPTYEISAMCIRQGQVLTLALGVVVDGEIDFWFNVFAFFSHCELPVG